MLNMFHVRPQGKSTITKLRFGLTFDTLEHMAGKTLVILYAHPLIFLKKNLSFLKFSYIFMNIDDR